MDHKNQSNSSETSGSADTESGNEKWQGKGRGRPNRNNSDLHQESASLRRPQQSSVDNNSVSDIVKNSVLSADAAEFVPKGLSLTPQTQSASGYVPGGRHSVQERLQIARQSQNVQQTMIQRHQHQPHWQQVMPVHQYHQHGYTDPSHVPYGVGYPSYNHHHVVQDYGQYDGGSGDPTDNHIDGADELIGTLMQLEGAMKTLTMNPGKFDSLVSHLVDTINPFLEQPESCQQIFNLILQQSINEGNFRYSGARLCTHLDTVASIDRPASVFRETLIKLCQEKTEEQAQTWRQITKHTAEDEKRCHGLIFFLAELVTQMEPDPASELGKLFIRLISTVLQNPAPNSAKNICQALKLAGQTLERDNSGNRMEMEQVMRTLSDLVIQGPADPSICRMVNSVTELRSGNWGRVITNHGPPPEINNEVSTSAQQYVDEPVFYGPDGQIITEEESRFLEDLAVDEYRNVQPAWENDEDDIIAEAYEEFLKYKPNSTQNENKKNASSVQHTHVSDI